MAGVSLGAIFAFVVAMVIVIASWIQMEILRKARMEQAERDGQAAKSAWSHHLHRDRIFAQGPRYMAGKRRPPRQLKGKGGKKGMGKGGPPEPMGKGGHPMPMGKGMEQGMAMGKGGGHAAHPSGGGRVMGMGHGHH
eukprot:CAMPEP_0179004958 /NCGR_PEP_ID=MMETSP0795-20121207/13616_1 /TAXON_ID=88552 /ORGANISM="Amoebophrya sp., Strain Ameob2" /LENGTH=136 /DNA_ID=CAMNT_0020699323 /DNA_START=260 /DNA_END=670 /DNA_ORIENTATION=-